MKTKLLLAAGALILFKSISVPAAGGWTSGGGELIRDQHNPWFIQNTKQVNYCVQINEKDFGQSREFVEAQIGKAINFWKNQLPDLTVSNFTGFSIQVGTQTFNKVECSADHDLAFQFGVLSDEQNDRLGDISKTIALTVRTDYDLKKLKGKGFIYLSKDIQFSTHPWSTDQGYRVLPVLVHEIGHIFGLQHSEDIQFMAENYPETIIDMIDKNAIEGQLKYLNQGGLEKRSLFKFRDNDGPKFMMCSSSGGIDFPVKPKPKMKSESESLFENFFHAAKDDNCLYYNLENKQFNFYSGKGKVDLIGTAKLIMEDQNNFFAQATPAISFWFPSLQEVFPSDYVSSYYITKNTIASFQSIANFKGVYKTLDGAVSRQVTFELSNAGSIRRIGGIYNGALYNNVYSKF